MDASDVGMDTGHEIADITDVGAAGIERRVRIDVFFAKNSVGIGFTDFAQGFVLFHGQIARHILDFTRGPDGVGTGAEDILLPERYDNDEQTLINHIIEGRKKGKKHHLIINAEGIGHSTGMARRIEAATGIETRATILGYMQRGGSPTCKDRMYASIMGAYAVDLLAEGKSNRLVAYRDGKFVDYDIDEALAMTKDINDYEFNISALLSK